MSFIGTKSQTLEFLGHNIRIMSKCPCAEQLATNILLPSIDESIHGVTVKVKRGT